MSSRFAAGYLGPAVLGPACMVGAWFALCSLMPAALRSGNGEAPPVEPTTRYLFVSGAAGGYWRLRAPIVLPSFYGASSLVGTETETKRLFEPVRLDLTKKLTRREMVRAPTAEIATTAVTSPATWTPYSPVRTEPGAFSRGQIGAGALVIEPTAGLRLRGFSIACPTNAVFPWTDEPWSVTAVVETDAGGAVSHVFLANPSPAEAINQEAVRLLRGGRLKEGGGECEGMVTVIWPGARHAPFEEVGRP